MQQPVFAVTLTGTGVFDVTIQQADATRWDMARAEHGWPAQDEAWNLWSTFVAFNAARRGGKIPSDMRFEVFTDLCERLELKAVDEVDPTLPDPTPGSVSS